MDVPAGLVITIGDINAAGYCARGARRWFEGYGYNFRDIITNGIPAEELLGLGDAHGERVVAARLARDHIAAVPLDLVITADDVKQSKKCMAGAREFAALHGHDYKSFLAHGIPAVDILKSGDPDGVAIIRDKLERARG
jgi:hypothetical protein